MSASEPPFRAIAESTYDWETWVDESGAVRWVNRAVERFTGYTPEECLALPDFPYAVIQRDDRERVRALMREALAGSSGNDVEFRIARRDGTELWVAISWQPLAHDAGGSRGLRTSVRDIHSRKLAEEKLRLAEREAARLARERTEFLASLSHELRSPLHCIEGFAELIERAPEDASRARWLGIIREQSHATLRLVEDLLHFVAGERREIAPTAGVIDLAAIVAGEVEAGRPRAKQGVALTFASSLPADARARGDADHARRVVANLLGNALRFTEAGSIDVRVEPRGELQAVVVRDTGVGMSRDLVGRVRAPFVQGAPSTASRGGVGLGLAIVERLVGAMGGSLELESEPSVGTTATATFRAASDGSDAIATESGGATDASARDPEHAELSVLVVDDSAPARELVVAMLGDLGVVAHQASGAPEALARAREAEFHLVLVDYHMPEVDGFGAVDALRREGLLGDAALVVLLTANVFVAREGGPTPAGIDRVVAKPLRLDELRRILRDATGRKLVRECLDDDVLRDLESMVDAEGRSLLERRGPTMIASLESAIDAIERALDDDARSRAAHALVGLALAGGARELALGARAVERGGGDTAGLRDSLARYLRALSLRRG